jgi:hypothetical protein
MLPVVTSPRAGNRAPTITVAVMRAATIQVGIAIGQSWNFLHDGMVLRMAEGGIVHRRLPPSQTLA